MDQSFIITFTVVALDEERRVRVELYEQPSFREPVATTYGRSADEAIARLVEGCTFGDVEALFGDCDECGQEYEVSSREGRCGDCGHCSQHCTHEA